MNKVMHLILHCAATPEGKSFTAKDIDKMHKQRKSSQETIAQ